MEQEEIINEVIPNGIVNVKGKGDGKPQYKAEKDVIRRCMTIYARQVAIAFLEDMRDYERESGSFIGFDERTSEEFYNLFIDHHSKYN